MTNVANYRIAKLRTHAAKVEEWKASGADPSFAPKEICTICLGEMPYAVTLALDERGEARDAAGDTCWLCRECLRRRSSSY